MGIELLIEELGQGLCRYHAIGHVGTHGKGSVAGSHEVSSVSLNSVKDLENGEKTMRSCLAVVEEVRSNVCSSVNVLNDLLNYDKVESGTLSLEITLFSFWDLLVETSSEFKLSAKKKGIHFELDFGRLLGMDTGSIQSFQDATIPRQFRELQVAADIVRISQVLRNLVSNDAIKFTPEGGECLSLCW